MPTPAAKGHKRGRRIRSPSPVQSSDSDIEDDDLEIDPPTNLYQPQVATHWTIPSLSGSSQAKTKQHLPHGYLVAAGGMNEGDEAAIKQTTGIDALPPEMLIHTFKQLSSVADLYSTLLVSHKWCECTVELLWLKPSFASPEALHKLFETLGNNTNTTFNYPSFIRRLNFASHAAEITNSIFLLLESCTRLERLTLHGCQNLSDEALGSVLVNMNSLVALDLTNVVEVSDYAVCTVALAAPRLQGINLEGCKRVTDEGVMAIAQNCPYLRRIKLCDLEEVTSASISVLATNCPLLIEIDLNQCVGISDICVRSIWNHSTQLRELRLGQCFRISNLAFPAAPRVPRVDTPTPPSDNSSAPRLILPSLPPLFVSQQFLNLRQLDLTNINISDESVEGIIANAPKIRNLVLAKCTALTDIAVKSICKLGKHLHCLHLGHASAITDASVTLLAKTCTRLRYVDLACCSLLTDESVRQLSTLPKLRRIGLVRVNNLTDLAVGYLATRHSTIERVHLSYCERITVPAIHLLLQKSHKLTHLSLTGVPAFRNNDLQKFCRPPPGYFNEIQREQFCVYSGHGVVRLRRYLETLQLPTYQPPSDPADDLSELDPDLELDVDENITLAPEITEYLAANRTPTNTIPPVLSHAIYRTQASAGSSRQSGRRTRVPTNQPPPSVQSNHSSTNLDGDDKLPFEEPMRSAHGISAATNQEAYIEQARALWRLQEAQTRQQQLQDALSLSSSNQRTRSSQNQTTQTNGSKPLQAWLHSAARLGEQARTPNSLASSAVSSPPSSVPITPPLPGIPPPPPPSAPLHQPALTSGLSSSYVASSSGIYAVNGAGNGNSRRTTHQHLRPYQLMTPAHNGPSLSSSMVVDGPSSSMREPSSAGGQSTTNSFRNSVSDNISDSSATSREREVDDPAEDMQPSSGELERNDRKGKGKGRDSNGTIVGKGKGKDVSKGRSSSVSAVSGRPSSDRPDWIVVDNQGPNPSVDGYDVSTPIHIPSIANGSTPTPSKGSSHRKGLRGTIMAAEHYASSLLFGGRRGSASNGGGNANMDRESSPSGPRSSK